MTKSSALALTAETATFSLLAFNFASIWAIHSPLGGTESQAKLKFFAAGDRWQGRAQTQAKLKFFAAGDRWQGRAQTSNKTKPLAGSGFLYYLYYFVEYYSI